MAYAKIFSLLVAGVTGLYGAIGFYFLPLASFEGDLTRVGMLPESYFGWKKEQPVITTDFLQQANWESADVLVIGDSFSEPMAWQSVLVKNGLRVRTETWGSLPAVCEDFTSWLYKNGFRGQYVILEIIERNTEGTLAKSLNCKTTKYRSATSPAIPPAPQGGKMSVGIRVYLNALRYEREMTERNVGQLDWPGDVHMERITDGCGLFSHARCNDVLFFSNDRHSDMGANIMSNMEEIGSRIKTALPIWVIIPDKTTTYLHPEKQFWNNAQQKFHAPNTLNVFRQSVKDHVIDLYPANNTHLSTTGYLILGEAIYQSLSH